MIKYLMAIALAALILGDAMPAQAFPAFARRYNVDCTTCHTVPPRLNNFGVAFMRRGFKMNWDEKLEGQKATDYFAIQKQLDLTNVDPNPAGGPPNPPAPNPTLQVSQLALLTAGPMSRQLSWYGELDIFPVAQYGTNVHELRAILLFPQKLTDEGSETYYAVSVGALRPFSTWQKGLTETHTLEAPLIFNTVPVQGLSFVPDNPQLGVEFSWNKVNPEGYHHGTYAAIAFLGGLNVNQNINTGPVSGPIGLSPLNNGSVDVEAQLAHYFGPRNSVALMYYNGNIRINTADSPVALDPTFPFNSHVSRLYLNGNWSPNEKWDFLAGMMIGSDDLNVSPVSGNFTNQAGPTNSSGAYVEANYYFNKTIVGALRYDTFTDSSTINVSTAAGTLGASGTSTAWTASVGAQVNKYFIVTVEYNDTTNPDATHRKTTFLEIKHIQ